jgi:Domain of unknown function (DUF5060)/Cellulase (glycosyl hydrolase family 5)
MTPKTSLVLIGLFLAAFCGPIALDAPRAAAATSGTYPMRQISFDLPAVPGNPFDFTQVDVTLAIKRPDGAISRIPAFFDGGTTWRARYTPDAPGQYAVSAITLNGRIVQPAAIDNQTFTAGGEPQPGFIRVDKSDPHRFVFDNGSVYYPLGYDAAWADMPPTFDKMGAVGLNWARVWMAHWSGMNLDWIVDHPISLGTLSLDVARRWDQAVLAAEKNGIYLQLTLQHHGQYSTLVNPNWQENPWNKQLGGFLDTPQEFFTNARAIALTKAKYRYIVARWGYSTHIMAWELFNEVESTDALKKDNKQEIVGRWHARMAAFLREQDPNRHLITTSSFMEIKPIWTRVDYYQTHYYIPDMVSLLGGLDASKLDKPYFIGEFGPRADLSEAGGEAFLHNALWASVVTPTAGAAQYWFWDVVQARHLYSRFAPVVQFVKQSGVSARRRLHPTAATTQTPQLAQLAFSPGADWGAARQTQFTVERSGNVQGIAEMPPYLQGDANRDLFPSATFHVDYPRAGSFAVSIGRVSRSGGRLSISVDGQSIVRADFPGNGRGESASNVTLEVSVPAGDHAVRLENNGADWLAISKITLDPYSPAIGLVGKSSRDYAALWLYRRTITSETDDLFVAGKLLIPGLEPGTYRATWFDTNNGRTVTEQTGTVAGDEPLMLITPPIAGDIAVYVSRSESRK